MSFLERIAKQLLDTYGTDLSKVTVVFPNKRASLFLNEHLARLCDKPIWSPSYITISDLFRSLSSREVADPIKLICDLYKSFIACTGIDETLDHFYGWGEILLADFDDVDKHLAPAEKVFANLRDIHEFDDDSYLTEQQREIIRKFFSNFNEDHNSELKQHFLSLWSHIYDIYVDFNARLASQNLAYEGALYRSVIKSLTKDSVVPFEKHSARGGTTSQDVFERNYTILSQMPENYVFVGFNLLHPVEQALIDALGDKAQVIQDTDEETPKDITFISAPTNNIQARYVSTWLKENHRIDAGSKTAIVLADESLLQAVIHCRPPEVTKVNITTGYPLSQTAAASNPKAFLNQTEASPLEAEAQFRMYTILNRLQGLVDSGDLQVEHATLQHLLTQIITSTTIPFHGEPVEGIQIMGVLETRNLDFDHVLLLSCNEGNLPKGINDTSFIPYSIRKAYGLTTIDNKVSIYANYFRRLLQRAKDVTIVYNNATTDGKTGEMSRFMLQMMVEGRHPITYQTLQAGQTPVLRQPKPVVKTEAVMSRLQALGTLSPSALSRYLRCPLQFFYRYVTGLDEYEEEDERIDNRLFGNIFHKAAQILYTHHTTIHPDTLEALLKSKVEIERAVDEAIKVELFHIEDPMAKMPPLNGLQLINREVIIRYVRQLVEVDRRLAPFTILGLEKKVSAPLSSLRIGGIIDRLDKITLPDGSERIRVVDYKTGSSRLKPLPDVASIFDPASLKNHSDYYLQTFLYSIIVEESLTESVVRPVSPCLLFIQHAGVDDYDPTLFIGKSPVTDIAEVQDEFMERLTTLVTEILSPDQPFLPTDDRTRCHTCPFFSLCGL